jgi:hypothetical protein
LLQEPKRPGTCSRCRGQGSIWPIDDSRGACCCDTLRGAVHRLPIVRGPDYGYPDFATRNSAGTCCVLESDNVPSLHLSGGLPMSSPPAILSGWVQVAASRQVYGATSRHSPANQQYSKQSPGLESRACRKKRTSQSIFRGAGRGAIGALLPKQVLVGPKRREASGTQRPYYMRIPNEKK